MKKLGYYNGRVGELDEMMVPMNDRASWFGDGVYEAELCRNGVIFALDEHVDRLFRSAAMIRITPPVTKDELKDILRGLVRRMDTGDLLVYYQITRGGGDRDHSFPAGPANLWVTLTPRQVNEGKTPVKLITAEDTRYLHCNIKTLNLIPSVLANQKAKEAGCYECVLYRPGFRVTEGSHSNVHALIGGVLYTSPRDNLILPGIAREHLIRVCEGLGIPVCYDPFTLDQLKNADEVLVTSSGNLCMHACEIDGRPAGMRCPELYEKIRSAVLQEYYQATEGTFTPAEQGSRLTHE